MIEPYMYIIYVYYINSLETLVLIFGAHTIYWHRSKKQEFGLCCVRGQVWCLLEIYTTIDFRRLG